MAAKLWVGGDGTGSQQTDWSRAANWSPSGVPVASDTVTFQSSSTYSVTAGLDQSSVSLGAMRVEAGYSGSIGTSSSPLLCDPASLVVDTGDVGASLYFDFGAQTLDVTVKSCSFGALGTYGVELSGAGVAISNLIVDSGKVGLCTGVGETATVTTARVSGSAGDLTIGTGVTLTNVDQSAGSILLACSVQDIDLSGGILTTDQAAAVSTSATVHGGTLNLDASGTVAALVVHGGTVNFRGGVARTVTALTLNQGSVSYDPQAITISTWNVADRPVTVSAST
jgi:hypothetical protein